MKKTLLLLASAALLLVSCAKEQIVDLQEGGLTNVTFTANLDNGVATKAVADNDGNGTEVNRCIMEIYFGEQFYKRLVEPVTTTDQGKKVATFANVPVVAGKQYQVLFWADCGGAEKADLYYTTTNLKTVTVAKTAFLATLAAGENDKLDAFYFADNYTISQNQTEVNAVFLKRPFAQLNVITTDLGTGKTVTCADLLPDKVSVSYKAADKFNVATGEISSSVAGGYTYSYEAPVYGTWSSTKTELTLSMDYILASTEQAAVDVTFKTFNNGDANPVMTHSLTNLPYKRNYRTNVKGDLLTVGGTWKAEIEPKWGNGTDTGEIDHKIATSYTEVKTALQSGDKSDNLKVTVTPAAVNNLSEAEKEEVIVVETIDGDPVKALKFVLYEEKKDGEQVTQHASPKHVEFELPKRPTDVKAWKIEYEPAYPTETVVVSTKEEDNANVIIEAPKSTVTLDATKINSVVSTTSENTLIIPQGLELKNLTVKKGAVEYHGIGLEKVTVSPIEGANVYFKTSEGLANTDAVYGVVKNYVAPGYAITKESADTWKIVPIVCKISETGYGSLADAVAAVPANAQTTITMVADHEILGNAGVTIAENQNVILDLAGHTVKILVNESKASQIITNNGTLKITGNGTLTNSLADGVIPGDWPTYNYVTNLITNLGTLTIENGTFANTQDSGITYTLDNNSNGVNAVATINGGTFTSVGNSAVRMFCNSTTAANTLTINGGYFEGYYFAVAVQNPNTSDNCGTLTINGGEFESKDDTEGYNACIANRTPKSSNIAVNIAGGKFNDYVLIASKASVTGGLFRYTTYTYPGDTNESKLADYVADGYAVVANTDAETKAEYPYTVKVKPVVKIGDVEYADIADAFAAVPTDGTPKTVTLLENIGNKVGDVINWKEYDRKFAYTVNANQNITFDLNGKKIYAKTTVNGYTGFLLVKNGGSLTIKDSAGGGELNYLDGMDNEGGLAISSEGSLTILSGTIENCTYGPNSAIQGAIDVHANEWGPMYEHELKFSMSGGVLKSNGNNTLRIFDSSQTGTGSVIIEFEITGGEVYGKDAIFIQPQWTKEYCQNSTYMNKVKVSVKGGTFDTTNGIRVYGAVNETNDKEYRAVQISVTGGNFTIRSDKDEKYRVNHVAFQNGDSTEGATAALRSYTDVSWTASDPIYSTPAQQ